MTLYDLLGIPQNAEYDEIRTAYFEKASPLYPERNTSAAKHEELMKLQQAYLILSKQKSRDEYDQMITPQKFETEEDPGAKPPDPVYLDPFDEWITIFLMSWRTLAVFPREMKIRRLYISFTIRILAALTGAFVALWQGLFVILNREDMEHFIRTAHYSVPIFAGIFFIGCRVLLYYAFGRKKETEDD